MVNLPVVAEPLLMSFSIAFTQPTFNRSLVLLIGAILAKGPRTITNLLWNVGDLAEGDPTDYHRVFSRAPWSLWKLGRVLAIAVIELAGRDDWIRVVVDCTVAEHKGGVETGETGTPSFCTGGNGDTQLLHGTEWKRGRSGNGDSQLLHGTGNGGTPRMWGPPEAPRFTGVRFVLQGIRA